MLKKLITAVFGVFILCSFVPVARAQTWAAPRGPEASAWGPHPWDMRGRAYDVRIIKPPVEYFEFLPIRSTTHALHPYWRHVYYSPAFTDRPVVDAGGRFVGGLTQPLAAGFAARRFYQQPRAEGDRVYDCMEYTYDRPNYRVPPYNFAC